MNRLTNSITAQPSEATLVSWNTSEGGVGTKIPPRPGRTVAQHVAQFVAAGLVALLVLAIGSVVSSRRAGTDQAIADAADRTATLTRVVIEEQLSPELLAGDPQAMGRLEWRMGEIFESETFLHLRLWNEEGRILYADQPDLVGTVLELSEEAVEAFETGQVVAEVSDLDEAENELVRSQGQLLEVYQPVVAADGTQLLFETYDSFDKVDRNARQIWWSFLPAVLGPLALLQLIQIPFAFRLARKVERAQNERAELLERVISSSDSERQSIAHDLHDGAVQDLAGVGYALSVVSDRAQHHGDDRSVELLDGVQVDVRRSIKSLRSLFVEIYPPNLQRSGLQVALSDLLGAVGGEMEVELHYPEELELPESTNQTLYRVAQEAIRNAARHSEARRLTVEVAEVPGGVTLRVVDDGKGFDPDQISNPDRPGHLGLRLMADMVAENNGVLDIYSKPGAGTDLRLQLQR